MTTTQSHESTARKPLRLWPAVVIAIIQVIVMIGGPIVAPDAPLPIGLIGGILGAWAIALWWLFFSRARWSERIGAILLMAVVVVATKFISHESMAGAGQGMLMYILPQLFLGLALVAWAAATRNLHDGARRAWLVATILLVCVPFALMRTDGIGGPGSNFHLRWTPTAEERLLALANDEPKPLPPPATPAGTPIAGNTSGDRADAGRAPVDLAAAKPAAVATPPAVEKTEPAAVAAATTPPPGSAMSEPGLARAEWPGFRGPTRDSVVRGLPIATDWSQKPPVQLWRRPIGPGWSSFAVRGDLLYTQEQRGDDEVVSAYNLKTGEPVWRHRDAARFYESNGGAGPRGTPSVSNGRVYAMGATGILNALDADNGSVIWSRNAATDTGVEVPFWGIASSPLVIDDAVIVAVSGRLAAYDGATGRQRWLGPAGGSGYSSPHLLRIDGIPQILLMRGSRTISVAPADGTLLWQHTWVPGVGIVQPAIISDGEILITVGDAMGGLGVRRLSIARGAAGWTVEERWTSRGLKPYFNDFVVHKGHAFGFDGNILASIDLANGERNWKGGRYGNGQMVLLADQDVLLVMSEEGQLALVSATTDKFTELARFEALDAKTWNHPVVVGDILLVRNGEEMAAFRLSFAGPSRKDTLEEK